jgi:hypothetical protein
MSNYRAFVAFFRDVAAQSAGGPIRLRVLAGPGKSHVEVIAAFRAARGTSVRSRLFARVDLRTLAQGFAEQAGEGA